MSAPLVVNTEDGTCWTRRDAVRDGQPLYAMADCQRCPELVMATYAELAEHGIVGSADVLPMPSGSAPVDAGPVVRPLALHEAQIDALAAAGNRVVNDQSHEDLCACDGWPERCLSSGGFFQGQWDVGGLDTALPAVLGLWESMRGGELERLRAEVAALREERHSTNEALDDAIGALRTAQDRIAELEALTPAAIQTCGKCGAGYSYGEPCSTCVFRARMAAETQALRSGPPSAEWVAEAFSPKPAAEGEFHAYLHRAFTTPHDLDFPGTGGAR